MLPSWLPPVVLGLALILLVGLELLQPDFRAASFGRDAPRTRRNLSFLAAAVAVALVLGSVEPALRAAWGGPTWGGSGWLLGGFELMACFALAELLGWGLHLVKHRVPYLWRFHFQHHQETRFDVWMVTHTHGLEVLVSGTLLSGALVVAGFSEQAVQAYFLFYALANTWQHSSRNLSLGPLDRVIVSPAYHRLHHEVRGRDEAGVNFGNTLVLWDWVFGTMRWPAGRAQPDVPVGIAAGPEPWGFWREMTWFLEPPEVDAEPELPRPAPRGASTF